MATIPVKVVGLPKIDGLMRIPVTWDKQRIVQDLTPDIEIELSPDALNKALADQAGRYAWWGMLTVKAKKNVSLLDQRLKTRKAELFTSVKAADPKLTVDGVKSAVDTHPDILALQTTIIDAEEDLGAVQVAQEAMRHRRDALVTISSNMRAEMEGRLNGPRGERVEVAKEKIRQHLGKPLPPPSA